MGAPSLAETSRARPAARGSALRRGARNLGTVFLVLGAIAIAYAAATLFWRDPVTDVYARWKQHELAAALERSFQEYAAPASASSPEAVKAKPGGSAKRGAAEPAERLRPIVLAWQKQLERGDPLGRIVVSELGI